eukprot:10753679-Alexandrium_andersonii.AAC.1
MALPSPARSTNKPAPAPAAPRTPALEILRPSLTGATYPGAPRPDDPISDSACLFPAAARSVCQHQVDAFAPAPAAQDAPW